MSQWTHPQCETDWIKQNMVIGEAGDFIRLPHRIVDPDTGYVGELATCCWCGQTTISGIFVRADPSSLQHHFNHE
jgi:hypothetical protein